MGGRRVRLAVAIGLLALPAPASAQLEAGAGTGDITPPVGTPMFGYTARSGIADPGGLPDVLFNLLDGRGATTFTPSDGIHTRPRARALVLRSPAGRFAVVQTDLGGLPYALTRVVAARIAALGIPAENLLLTATHTHASTGPIWPNDNLGYALLGGDLFDNRVFDLTVDGIVEAIARANGRLEPARLGTATVQVTDATRNRNFEPFRRNADVPRAERAARAASIDPDLTVVRVDRRRGGPIALWSNFAVHPTSLSDDNLLFSGDNVGFANRIVEARVAALARKASRRRGGGLAPVHVFTNSNEGDMSPAGGPTGSVAGPLQYARGDLASAHMAGLRMGRATVRAWRAAGKRLSGSVALGASRAFVAFDGTPGDGQPVGPIPALGIGGIVGPDGTCAPVENLAGAGQGRKMPAVAAPALVPNVHPIAAWRIGRLGIAAFPAEITRQMGLRIRAAIGRTAGSRLDRVALAGLANSYVSYTATPEEYDACAYEGSFTLFGRNEGARWRESGSRLMATLFGGAPPDGAGEPPAPALPFRALRTPRSTPSAGAITRQPPAVARRFETIRFAWRGGDPLLDAPRGRVFVALERRDRRGRWQTVLTDDSYADTVQRDAEDVWTETLTLDWCAPLGVHRFVVTGVAEKGAGPTPYRAVSREFTIARAAPLRADFVGRSRGRVLVRALYAQPPAEPVIALPRRVLTGRATLRVGRKRVRARASARRLGFSRRAPRRGKVRLLGLRDRCGNRLAG